MKDRFAKYQQQSINTATPQELTLMLYNGCIKFINLAEVAMENNNIELRNLNIQKAENIIEELNLTLDMNYEVSHNLRLLYEFINRKLVEANIDHNKKLLGEVKGLVSGLRDTWKEAMVLANKKG